MSTFERIRWKKHFHDFFWSFLIGPFATGLYVSAAMLLSAFISAAFGLHPLYTAMAATMVVLIVNPKRRLKNFKAGR
ncbi:hypothetical protein [Pararhizobium sp. LjRoot238]|uniref:hypothetical protein n=1 Tax=Pararhizobium sp. LjRoot238 TaxID=3342293 RepID=UPI003ED0001E